MRRVKRSPATGVPPTVAPAAHGPPQEGYFHYLFGTNEEDTYGAIDVKTVRACIASNTCAARATARACSPLTGVGLGGAGPRAPLCAQAARRLRRVDGPAQDPRRLQGQVSALPPFQGAAPGVLNLQPRADAISGVPAKHVARGWVVLLWRRYAVDAVHWSDDLAGVLAGLLEAQGAQGAKPGPLFVLEGTNTDRCGAAALGGAVCVVGKHGWGVRWPATCVERGQRHVCVRWCVRMCDRAQRAERAQRGLRRHGGAL